MNPKRLPKEFKTIDQNIDNYFSDVKNSRARSLQKEEFSKEIASADLTYSKRTNLPITLIFFAEVVAGICIARHYGNLQNNAEKKFLTTDMGKEYTLLYPLIDQYNNVQNAKNAYEIQIEEFNKTSTSEKISSELSDVLNGALLNSEQYISTPKTRLEEIRQTPEFKEYDKDKAFYENRIGESVMGGLFGAIITGLLLILARDTKSEHSTKYLRNKLSKMN